jgi:hypothetical protein
VNPVFGPGKECIQHSVGKDSPDCPGGDGRQFFDAKHSSPMFSPIASLLRAWHLALIMNPRSITVCLSSRHRGWQARFEACPERGPLGPTSKETQDGRRHSRIMKGYPCLAFITGHKGTGDRSRERHRSCSTAVKQGVSYGGLFTFPQSTDGIEVCRESQVRANDLLDKIIRLNSVWPRSQGA